MSDTDELIRRYEERLAALEDRLNRMETGQRSGPASPQVRGGLRLGVDVGGTFTDLLLIDPASGGQMTAKVPSTPEDSSIGVRNGIEKIGRASCREGV